MARRVTKKVPKEAPATEKKAAPKRGHPVFELFGNIDMEEFGREFREACARENSSRDDAEDKPSVNPEDKAAPPLEQKADAPQGRGAALRKQIAGLFRK